MPGPRPSYDRLRREQLEALLEPYRAIASAPRPARGWVRAIREALGMSAEQLARRAAVSRSTIATLERSEARGTITLESLDKLARGLGCRVTYALVPDQGASLDDLRRQRAQALARESLRRVSHTMKLEAQELPPVAEQRQLERLVDELLAGSPRKLWR